MTPMNWIAINAESKSEGSGAGKRHNVSRSEK